MLHKQSNPGPRPRFSARYHCPMEDDFICGYPDQWKAFQQRNHKFLARFDNLKNALNLTFVRTIDSESPEERVVFVLGRLCVEDFFEIIQLAGNGYGYGALRLLRSLFERAVTMAFLSENPTQVDAYLNYHAVAQHKLMRALKESFGPTVLPVETLERTEREYLKVKDDYLFESCSQCHAKRVHYTWNKLDIVSMARKTDFGSLIVAAYYIPMSHAHSTVQSILSRIEKTDEGGAGFNPDAQPKEADLALKAAHNIVLGVIKTQKKFFKLDDLDTPLQTCFKDFMEI
jgi:hypothetical protein